MVSVKPNLAYSAVSCICLDCVLTCNKIHTETCNSAVVVVIFTQPM